MERKHEILETIHKLEENVHIYLIFCAFGDFYCDVVNKGTSMFVWGVV